MADIHQILKRWWGYDAFRPQQEAIVNSVLSGKDTLALLPTGAGKSLCYQVPSMAQEGICLVVSPLIALMKDQVENLKRRGIGALVIYSGMSRRDIVLALENARQPYFKFLYVSPERLETSLFKEYLPALTVNLIAVDEAHCISQWGSDFRPSYQRIAALRQELPGVPVLAVTASATEAVQKDICEKLQSPRPPRGDWPMHKGPLCNNSTLVAKSLTGESCAWQLPPWGTEGALGDQGGFVVFRQTFERKNISYSVFLSPAKAVKLVEILKKVGGSAIVYCKSRKRTTEVAALLQMHGLSAGYYHAGLESVERSKRQQAWIENKTRLIVCTNAFGMGIDKPDVRVVVHMDAPDCLENYYQEAGRCGRDGQKAYAVLLYDERDVTELEGLHAVRYPSFETIKIIYDALVNFLQIPVNHGQDQSFAFRMDDFVRNFKLNVHQALYSLQALASDGWIEYNEKAFTPATLQFITSKERLYEFYKVHPHHEALLTTLLRTYEGIFDHPAFISETLLAKLLRSDEAAVKTELQKITSYGIIRYQPVNDAPQIIFRKNRVVAADLTINLTSYHQRKTIFVERVAKMIEYINLKVCRSQAISLYFGDAGAKPCGTCDNCLHNRRTALTATEFNAIADAMLKRLDGTKLAAADLVEALRPVKREHAWEVLRFLQAESRVTASTEGLLSVAGH